MDENGPSSCRVLAIQSHVVSGYVGNKCAAFPLQLHGFEVDFINSVQFSNHTGYSKGWKGQVLTSNELWDLYEGLKMNGLNQYTHLLTGYVADESFLVKIREIVTDLRKRNSRFVYICDPVLGDNGAYYVPKSLTGVYRESILQIADVITPNQFELQELWGHRVECEETLLEAISHFHARGIKHIIVTSSDLGASSGFMFVYASSNGKCYRYEIPRLDAIFVGTGDVFTTLLLVWLHKTGFDIAVAVTKVLASIQDILKRTLNNAKELAGQKEVPTAAQLELQLIQSKDDIMYPKSVIKMVELS